MKKPKNPIKTWKDGWYFMPDDESFKAPVRCKYRSCIDNNHIAEVSGVWMYFASWKHIFATKKDVSRVYDKIVGRRLRELAREHTTLWEQYVEFGREK